MAGVLVNGVKQLMLDERLSRPPFTTLEMGLFTGAYVPVVGSVIGDLTEQVGMGYARVAVTGWSGAILLGDGHSFSQADICTFTNGDVVPWLQSTGWFWYATGPAKLVRAARFTVPFVIPAGLAFSTYPFELLTGE